MHDERIQLMSLVAKTYRHLADNLARQLEQAVGISPVFFDVLIHIAVAPGSQLTMSRLSSQVALTNGGMTRLVDRMVEAGLVLRQNSSSDRRSIQVVLTEAGQKVLKRAVAAHVENIDRYLVAPLDDNDRASLAVTLGKVLGHEPSGDDVLSVR
jgi:DNA-binding MarR family transcriptional regulator